jgi:hypothetical protein
MVQTEGNRLGELPVGLSWSQCPSLHKIVKFKSSINDSQVWRKFDWVDGLNGQPGNLHNDCLSSLVLCSNYRIVIILGFMCWERYLVHRNLLFSCRFLNYRHTWEQGHLSWNIAGLANYEENWGSAQRSVNRDRLGSKHSECTDKVLSRSSHHPFNSCTYHC